MKGNARRGDDGIRWDSRKIKSRSRCEEVNDLVVSL